MKIKKWARPVDAHVIGCTWESSRKPARRSTTAQDLGTDKYRQRVVPNKKRYETIRRVDVPMENDE